MILVRPAFCYMFRLLYLEKCCTKAAILPSEPDSLMSMWSEPKGDWGVKVV